MSRLDLNGLSRNRIDNEDEFEFAVLPEDDLEGCLSLCEEIDAINTETFGDDIDATEFDDLEVYSKQTAGLKLEDGELAAWANEPSCSVSAPDPSQLPDPTFESVLFPDVRFSQSDYDSSGFSFSSAFELNLGTVDSLFSHPHQLTESSTWGAPDLSSLIDRSAHDFINKPDNIGEGAILNNKSQEDFSVSLGGKVTPRKPPLAEIPKNALTVEELEKKQLEEVRNKKLPEVPKGAIALEDLEKQILSSSVHVKEEPKPLEISTSPEMKPPVPLPLSPQPPLPFPFPHPMMHPFMFNLYRARMGGQMIEPSVGLPLVPPQMRMAFFESLARNANSVGSMRFFIPPQMPGLPMPSFPPVMQAPQLRMNSALPSVAPRMPFQMNGQGFFGGKIYREPQIKKTGMPSTKTISDFAFDPYAGFMSKKEREWLIKIQVLQCQGTGNPFEDDYYYTVWKEQQLSSKRNGNNALLDKTEAHAAAGSGSHYVPPTFAGSLGKPTASTVNNPRHLIDLHREGAEEDDRSNAKGSSQKRFRALLLMVENIAEHVLACEERKRQLSSPGLADEARAQLEQELKSFLQNLSVFLCSEKLSTVITLSKGRQMFVRTFSLLNKADKLLLLKAFVEKCLPVALKMVPQDELVFSLQPALFSFLAQSSKDEIIGILNSFVVDGILTVPANLSNKFFCQMLLAVLFFAARERIDLGVDCASSSLYKYLCGRKYPIQLPVDWRGSMSTYFTFGDEDVAVLRQWLQKQFQRHPSSIALLLARRF